MHINETRCEREAAARNAFDCIALAQIADQNDLSVDDPDIGCVRNAS